tara:strand:- start:47760 stop:49049 length:1290 start_codon:yes stop_codon:yes gene_type:complete
MNAITLNRINKSFRRVTLKSNYTTIKSSLLGLLSSRNKSSDDGDNRFNALTNISFVIPEGEMLGIIGRNGSGKSTLLKIMAGIYKPDKGSMDVVGRVSALIELGAGFHPDFSGRENVFINASILGMSRKQILEKFDEIVSFAELEKFIDNPVRTYSSGMFMRLGFSVAIHSSPDILLVDEVLAVGDESFSHKCKDRINAFKKAGKTIVFVTHSMSDVERLCDRVVWLESGSIKDVGSPRKVIDSYFLDVAEEENKLKINIERSENKPGKDSKAESGQVKRWGSKEVEITNVVLKGSTGEERLVFQTGDSISITMEYVANLRVEEPVFGVAVYKQDGSFCYGTNTDIEKLDLNYIEGHGSVTMNIERLDLVEDSYTISVATHARDGHPWDYHDQLYEFSIRSNIKDVGVFRPPHYWEVNGERKIMKKTKG